MTDIYQIIYLIIAKTVTKIIIMVKYNVIVRLPPIVSLEENWDQVAGDKNKNEESMLPHPLEQHSHTPVSPHVHLPIYKIQNQAFQFTTLLSYSVI